MKYALAAVLALGLASQATAQSTPPAATTAAQTSPSVDSDRLAKAALVVDQVFPVGTYARLMNGSLDAVMKSAMDSVSSLPLRDLARMGGISEDKVKTMGPGSLREVVAIIDPAHQQRTELAMNVLMTNMTGVMSQMEPEVRSGLTVAYANHFSAAQLQELQQFFATPTGRDYAANSMFLFMDPAVMDKMQALMPELAKQMPAILTKIEAATKDLPKPREYADLSRTERAQLAKLLGVSEAELARHDHKN